MAPKPSAGLLLWRRGGSGVEVLIAHMGGPFWARKDAHAWSIPKGEFDAGEGALEVARREFLEELGVPAPAGDPDELGTFRYSSGKTVTVFAQEASGFEVEDLHSNTFDLEWPPRSGRTRSFPEVDDVRWVALAEAREKLVAGQVPALDVLSARAGAAPAP
jgi:predicted NUDIX family NTP pyrophosphohydrolase